MKKKNCLICKPCVWVDYSMMVNIIDARLCWDWRASQVYIGSFPQIATYWRPFRAISLVNWDFSNIRTFHWKSLRHSVILLWQSQGAELCKSHQIWNTTLFLVVLILNKRSSNVKKILIVNSCLRLAINLRMGTLLCILHSICWTVYNKLVHLWKELKLEEVFPYIVWEKDKSISLCGIE